MIRIQSVDRLYIMMFVVRHRMRASNRHVHEKKGKMVQRAVYDVSMIQDAIDSVKQGNRGMRVCINNLPSVNRLCV